MRTVIVLSALSETTLPRRTLGAPVPCSAGGVPSPRASPRLAFSLARRRERAAAFWRRSSLRSSGVAGRRVPRRARLATLRSLGVEGGAWGAAGAAGVAVCAGGAGALALLGGRRRSLRGRRGGRRRRLRGRRGYGAVLDVSGSGRLVGGGGLRRGTFPRGGLVCPRLLRAVG